MSESCLPGLRRSYGSYTVRAAARSILNRVRKTPIIPLHATSASCVVVGGGVGGLVAAAKLGQQGYQVTVVEKNTQVGGRCQSDFINGYRFDSGPSLLLFPNTYKETFAWLGSDLAEHVQIAKVPEAAYRVFFAGAGATRGTTSSSSIADPSSSYLDLLYDVQAMVEQLEQEEPGAGTQYLSWLADARQALVVGTREFIERDFDGVWDFLDVKRLLPLLWQVNILELLGNHHKRLSLRFRSPRICALLSLQDLYVGLSPYTAPGVFSLLAATEITDGVWTPIGGFGKVRDGLLAVAQHHGVEVRTNAQVVSINTARGAVSGVTLEGGEVLQAQLVIANRDVSMSYGLCDAASGLQYKQQQLAAKDFSAGVIAYYWCVDKQLEGLRHHNVFLSDQHEASWVRARNRGELQPYPNFYLHAPSRTDPSAAPPGCDSIMVLLPVANIQQRAGDKDFKGLTAAGKQLIFNSMAAAGIDLQDRDIVHERTRDPSQWRELYGVEHGAAFGLSHQLNQLALFRPAIKDEQVGGLYFTGASSRPGNGVPLVMIGGRLTAERILRDAPPAIVAAA